MIANSKPSSVVSDIRYDPDTHNSDNQKQKRIQYRLPFLPFRKVAAGYFSFRLGRARAFTYGRTFRHYPVHWEALSCGVDVVFNRLTGKSVQPGECRYMRCGEPKLFWSPVAILVNSLNEVVTV